MATAGHLFELCHTTPTTSPRGNAVSPGVIQTLVHLADSYEHLGGWLPPAVPARAAAWWTA
jgi:hypothetical protein